MMEALARNIHRDIKRRERIEFVIFAEQNFPAALGGTLAFVAGKM